MKLFSQNLFACFVISFAVCSCYSPRYIYSPPTQNIPSLNKKNDAELSAFYAGTFNALNKKGDNNYGFDFHAAWAFSKSFGVMINETDRRESNNANDTYFLGDTSALSYKINGLEIAGGYYSSSRENKKMIFQFFTGAALGTLKISDAYVSSGGVTDKFYNSRVTKFFIQPSFMYNPAKYFSTAISSRFTAVFFNHIKTNYTKEEQDNYILDSVSEAPVFFWEPAVTYTFLLKKFPFKLRLQGSLSVLLNHRFVEHESGTLAFGIVSDFDEKRKTYHHHKTNSL